MAKKVISCGLSRSSIEKAIKEIGKYKEELIEKTKILSERLAQEGVTVAKMQILSFPAVDTGQLLNSINLKPGTVITNGAEWIIYTGCPYAKYVEYGTGIRGEQNPHPKPAPGWEYDVNQHGDSGWFYMGEDGEWHWTKGMAARPFFYNTTLDLAQKTAKIAKEVFGGS